MMREICLYSLSHPLREKCPNTELFFGPYFPVFGLFVFSPNKGKYGPEITPYLDTFHAVINEDFPKVMKKLATQVIQQRFSPNAARGQ